MLSSVLLIFLPITNSTFSLPDVENIGVFLIFITIVFLLFQMTFLWQSVTWQQRTCWEEKPSLNMTWGTSSLTVCPPQSGMAKPLECGESINNLEHYSADSLQTVKAFKYLHVTDWHLFSYFPSYCHPYFHHQYHKEEIFFYAETLIYEDVI